MDELHSEVLKALVEDCEVADWSGFPIFKKRHWRVGYLSLTVFMIIMDKRDSGECSVWEPQIFFADDMILLASLEDDFQCSPGPFSAECKATEINFQVSGRADIIMTI